MTPAEKARFAEKQMVCLVLEIAKETSPARVEALRADVEYWFGEIRRWDSIEHKVQDWRARGLI